MIVLWKRKEENEKKVIKYKKVALGIGLSISSFDIQQNLHFIYLLTKIFHKLFIRHFALQIFSPTQTFLIE